jgi:hypothetical protein
MGRRLTKDEAGETDGDQIIKSHIMELSFTEK